MIFQTSKDLNEILSQEQKQYKKFKKANYVVDIARGKPCKEQLDSVMGFFTELNDEKLQQINPYRNYGMPQGIQELRDLFAPILGVKASQIIVGGNSSLNLMYDAIQRAMQFGVLGMEPWNKQGVIKFLCPSPGYDRHFAITEHLGIEMITVPMTKSGPDMDIIEQLVLNDESIKGIWCVPKYSNPTGITYTDAVVTRLAKMKTAAKDFRIFWDNAYVVHDLVADGDKLLNIMEKCNEFANDDRVYIFSSTSKITFPGAGVSFFASSEANVNEALKHMSFQTIGFNKVNQMMHYLFIKDADNLKKIMARHAEIIKPKFDKILNKLEESFGLNSDIAQWTKPNGGYFISLNVLEGCATEVFKLCKEAGLTLTNVGATFPYSNDPMNRNLRIAPTFIKTEDLDIACDILINCIKIACIKKLLQK